MLSLNASRLLFLACAILLGGYAYLDQGVRPGYSLVAAVLATAFFLLFLYSFRGKRAGSRRT